MKPAALIITLTALITALLSWATPAGAVEGGGVLPFAAPDHGSVVGTDVGGRIVGLPATATGGGYWQVASDGGIFTFGDARFFGSAGGVRLARPIVGMAATPSGRGYWLVASDGGIFAYGDARFFGSAGGVRLARPIVGMAATPSGRGYWLVASDGGIFTYGDARFFGSAGPLRPAHPVVAVSATPSGRGYLLVARDGAVFGFGDAVFAGSAAGRCLTQEVVGIAGDGDGHGYWLATSPRPAVVIPAGTAPVRVVALQSGDVTVDLQLRQACQGRATARPGYLSHPVAGAPTSTGFGPRVHPIFGVPQLHTGIDLAAAAGTPIRSPGAGTVVSVEHRAGYGLTTVIDHGRGVATVLAHQRRALVAAGTTVGRGQVVGEVGSTGYATGPHLHFEVRLHGTAVDPRHWL